MTETLLLCDCGGSQSIDRDRLAEATGMTCPRVATGLCTHQLDQALKAMEAGGTVIACQQEATTFEQMAQEAGLPEPLTVDIRDRAGWSDGKGDPAPKMAALLADAMLPRPATKTVDVISEGLTLVIGTAAVALPAAETLGEALGVTCLLTDAAETVPVEARQIDIIAGTLRGASGTFGRFEVRIDALRRTEPGGRGELAFGPARDGGRAGCDILIDLSGNPPLFPAHEKRDGYFRADPGDPNAVARVLLDASQAVGTFEKPLHVGFEESLCAHSRAEKPACTRCLDICPTGAITPDGDHVAIDPMICAGCGACSSVCPSGAVTYDDPPAQFLFRRITTLAEAYRKAGGTDPVLMLHDDSHGREMIALAARHGRGLPAHVIPLELGALATFGHAEALLALAAGFGEVLWLIGPKADRAAIEGEAALAAAILGDGPERLHLLDPADPDGLSDLLYRDAAAPIGANPVLALGGRRETTRLAAKALALTGAPALPKGAPYGAVVVDTDACTLCLACASLCPPGALTSNPDSPELLFREDACLQCGLCTSVCPESAITLDPRLNLGDDALSETVMKAEEPFACIECGTLFGVKSTIERITEKLQGKHSMFTNSDNAKLIQMCDDCRVRAQFRADDNPFQMGERPRVRTTDDYKDS